MVVEHQLQGIGTVCVGWTIIECVKANPHPATRRRGARSYWIYNERHSGGAADGRVQEYD